MKEFGAKLIANYAYQLGVESKLDEVPALCLGTTDLSVLELVGAYSSFVNKGIHIKPMVITRIEDRNGRLLEEFTPQTNTALSEEKAYLMVDLLKGVVDEEYGTANRLRYRYNFKNEIAGKTGTTQDNSDGWFVGMVPNLVSGAWVGCSEREMRFHSTGLGQGANTSLPIWAIYMKKVYADKSIGLPQEPFEKPANWDSRCVPYRDAASVLKQYDNPPSGPSSIIIPGGQNSEPNPPSTPTPSTPTPSAPQAPKGSLDQAKPTSEKPSGLGNGNWD
jgi:penicillin-binding protein 1A